MKQFAMITVAALGALLATAPSALAGDTNCSSIVNAGAFQIIHGNLAVDTPTCALTGGGVVVGNVTVGTGDGLDLEGNWTINGNLQANNCAYVDLNGTIGGSTVVSGDVQIQNCNGNGAPNPGAFFSVGPASIIFGNFTCQNNTAACFLGERYVSGDPGMPFIYFSVSYVGGNVQVQNNNSFQSNVYVNVIGKNLQCQNNRFATIFGGTVLGNTQGCGTD